MSIDFELSQEQALICQTVEQFALNELREAMRDYEAAEGVPDSLRLTFAELGLERLLLPEAAGGLAADNHLAVLVNERLAYGDAAAAVALTGWESVSLALEELASAEQAGQLLNSLLGQRDEPSWGAVAFSESAMGERPSMGLATRAVRVDGSYRLSGEKVFVRCAEGALLTVVLAQDEGRKGWDNLAAFAVEGSPEGMNVERMGRETGLLAAPSYRIGLEDVVVPASNRLGINGDTEQALRRFVARSALCNAARCVGLMRAAWEYARDYASERVAFGKPIAHFQAIAFMLSDMATLTDASRWSVWQAAYQLDVGGRSAVRDAASAVANAYDSVNRVAEDAVQILGGAGYVEDYPAEKWMRDARCLSLAFGDSEFWLGALGHEVLRSGGEAGFDELFPVPGIHPIFT